MKIVIPNEWKYLFQDQDTIEIDDLFETIDNLNYIVDKIQKEYDEFKNEVEYNYKYVPQEEQIGWSENW